MTRYIREGWQIDDAAAERALAYFRQYAEDGIEHFDEREVAFDFLRSHGQSLDWVFCGDPSGLICGLARHSERAIAASDGEVTVMALAVGDRALQARSALSFIVTEDITLIPWLLRRSLFRWPF